MPITAQQALLNYANGEKEYPQIPRDLVKEWVKLVPTIADEQKMFEAVAADYLNWGVSDLDGEDMEEVKRIVTNFVEFARGRLCVEFK